MPQETPTQAQIERTNRFLADRRKREEEERKRKEEERKQETNRKAIVLAQKLAAERTAKLAEEARQKAAAEKERVAATKKQFPLTRPSDAERKAAMSAGSVPAVDQKQESSKFRQTVLPQLQNAIAKKDPRVIDSRHMQLIDSAFQQKYITPEERTALKQGIISVKDGLTEPLWIKNEKGEKIVAHWNPMGDVSKRRPVQQNDFIQYGDPLTGKLDGSFRYVAPKNSGDAQEILAKKLDQRKSEIARASAVNQMPTDDELKKKAVRTELGAIRRLVTTVGTDEMDQNVNKYLDKSNETGQYDEGMEKEALASSVRAGVASVPYATGNFFQNFLPEGVKSDLYKTDLLLSDRLNQGSELAGKTPAGVYGYTVGQHAVSLPMAWASTGALINTSRTLGGALLAPYGKAAVGQAIGLGVGAAIPVGVEAAAPFMSKDAAEGARFLTNIGSGIIREGTPESVGQNLSVSDPNGKIQEDATRMTDLAIMGPASIGLWRDVVGNAKYATQLYRRALTANSTTGFLNKSRLASTILSRQGQTATSQAIHTDLAFGATPALSTIGQSIAYAFKDKSQRPEELHPVNWGTSLGDTLLGLGLMTRVPGGMHQLFEANLLGRMEPRIAARNYAENFYNKQHPDIAKLAEYYELKTGVQPNKMDIIKILSDLERTNNTNRAAALTNRVPIGEDAPTVYQSTSQILKAFTSDDPSLSYATRERVNSLLAEVRPHDQQAAPGDDFSLSELSKIEPSAEYVHDRVSKSIAVRNLTNKLTPHFAQLMANAKSGGAKPEVNNDGTPEENLYWGIKINDTDTLVINKESGQKRIIQGESLPNVEMVNPFDLAAPDQINTQLQEALANGDMPTRRFTTKAFGIDATKLLGDEPVDDTLDPASVPAKEWSETDRVVIAGIDRHGRIILKGTSTTDADGNTLPQRIYHVTPNDLARMTASDSEDLSHYDAGTFSYAATGRTPSRYTDMNESVRPDGEASENYPLIYDLGGAKVPVRYLGRHSPGHILQSESGDLFVVGRKPRGAVEMPPITQKEAGETIKSQLDAGYEYYSRNRAAPVELKLPVSTPAGDLELSVLIPADLAIYLQRNSDTLAESDLRQMIHQELTVPKRWLTESGQPVASVEIGSVVRTGSGQEYIVVSTSDGNNGVVYAKPADNMYGPTTVITPDSGKIAENISHEVLQKIRQNLSSVQGMTTEMMYPSSEDGWDMDYLRVKSLFSGDGKAAVLIPSITEASPETIGKQIERLLSDWTNHASGYNRPYPEIDDVSVNVSRGKSLEISLIAYMKANPEAAHLVLPELSARLYEVFETADDSDMGESVQRYRQQVSIPMAIALDYISSSNDIQTTLDAIAESLTEPATVSSDTMYSASPRKPISDYHAVFSAAMRINALVLSKNTPIGDARINTLIDNVVREMSYSGDKTALHGEIKKLAGRLRGVHEALIPRMLRNPQKRWMVKAFSGLPADVQALAFRLPVNPSPDMDPKIAAWESSEQKFQEAISWATHLYEMATDKEALILDWNSKGYHFFSAIAQNPILMIHKADVSRRLQSDPTAGRLFQASTKESDLRNLRRAATERVVKSALVLIGNEANGTETKIPIRETVLALTRLDTGQIPEVLDSMSQRGASELMALGTVDLTPGTVDRQAFDDKIANLIDQYKDAGKRYSEDAESLFDFQERFEAQGPDGRTVSQELVLSGKNNEDKARLQAFRRMPIDVQRQVQFFLTPWKTLRRQMNFIASISDDVYAHEALLMSLVDSDGDAFPLQAMFRRSGNYIDFISAANDVVSKIRMEEQESRLTPAERAAGGTASGSNARETSRRKAMAELRKAISDNMAAEFESNGVDSEPAVQAALNGFAQVAGQVLSENVLKYAYLNARGEAKDALGKYFEAQETHRRQADEIMRNVDIANEYNMRLDQLLAAKAIASTNTTNFLGYDLPSAASSDIILISDAINELLHGKQGRILTQADVDEIMAEAGKLEQAIARLEDDTKSYGESPDAALVLSRTIQIDTATGQPVFRRVGSSDAADQVTAFKVFNKAGLEALLLTAMKNEHALTEKVAVSDFIGEKTAQHQEYERMVRSSNRLKDYLSTFVFGGVAKKFYAVYDPSDTSKVDPTSFTGESLDGQAVLNYVYNKAKTHLAPDDFTNFKTTVTEYLNTQKIADGRYELDHTSLARILNLFKLSYDSVMQRTVMGDGFGMQLRTTDAMSLAYRITGRLATLEQSGVTTITKKSGMGNSLFADKFTKPAPSSLADIAMRIDVSSLPTSTQDISTDELQLLLDDYVQLKKHISQPNSGLVATPDQIKSIDDAVNYYKAALKDKAPNQKELLATKTTRILTEFADIVKLSKATAEFHDMFAFGQAARNVEMEIGKNLNKEEYYTLLAAGGFSKDLVKQVVQNQLSVGQMLSESTSNPLTKSNIVRLRALRMAQLKQDYYNSHNQLFIATSESLSRLDNAEKIANRNIGEEFGSLTKLGLDTYIRQEKAVANLLFLASKKGVARTGLTIAHEIGHHVFDALPDYLQLEYLKAIFPDKGTNKATDEPNESLIKASDLVSQVNKAYDNWKAANPSAGDYEFKIADHIQNWKGWAIDTSTARERNILHEVATSALTNFIMSDGVVISDAARASRSEHAIGVINEMGSILAKFNQQVARTSNDAVFVNGQPLNGFLVSPKAQSLTARTNHRSFYQLKHGSLLQFTSFHQRNTSGALRSVTAADVLNEAINSNNPVNLDFARWMLGGNVNSLQADEIISSVRGGLLLQESSIQAGSFRRQAPDSVDMTSSGQRITGRIVGMVMSTDFTSAEQAEKAGYTPAFTKVNATGKNVVWVHADQREGTNKWYTSSVKSQSESNNSRLNDESTSASNARVTAIKHDYAYVVESAANVTLFKTNQEKTAAAEFTTGRTYVDKAKTVEDVRVRYLVGHDAFDVPDAAHRPYIVETGKLNNPQFSSVMYSMMGRVAQLVRQAGMDISYEQQERAQAALAREYNGQPTAFEDVFGQAVFNDLESRGDNLTDVLANRNVSDLRAIQTARVGSWTRLKENARQFNVKLKTLGPDLIDPLNEFLTTARSNMWKIDTGTRTESLKHWYAGVPSKLTLNGRSADSDLLNRFFATNGGTLESVSNVLESIYSEYNTAREEGREVDLSNVDIQTTVDINGTRIDIAPRLLELFNEYTDESQVQEMAGAIYGAYAERIVNGWLNEHGATPDRYSTLKTLSSRALLNPDVNGNVTLEGIPTTFTDGSITHDVIPALETLFSNEDGNVGRFEARLDDLKRGLPVRVYEDSAQLDTVNKATLNWISKNFYPNQDSFREFLNTLTNSDGTVSPTKRAQAVSLFNSVRHIQNVDARMRRNALRNWGSWAIHDTQGDSLILKAPGRDTKIAGYDKGKYGSLIAVNLQDGTTSYVAETTSYRLSGPVKIYKPVKSFDQFMAYQRKYSTSNHRSTGDTYTAQQVLGRNYIAVLRDLLPGVQISDTPIDIMLPSRDWFTSSSPTNDGMTMYRVRRVKGELEFKEMQPWWEGEYVEQQDLNQVLNAATHGIDPDLRSRVLNRQIMSEEYHIAQLLLARDKHTQGPHSQQLTRVNDQNIFRSREGKLTMRDVSDNTWYSSDPSQNVHEQSRETPLIQSLMEAPPGIENDVDTLVSFHTAKLMDQIEAQFAAAEEGDLTVYRDESAKDPIGVQSDRFNTILRIKSDDWDEVTNTLFSASGPTGTGPTTPAAAARATKPGTAMHLPGGKKVLKGTKGFIGTVLNKLNSDFRYILSNDLSSWAIQMSKGLMSDALGNGNSIPFAGLITTAPTLLAMATPNWRDIPFFIGPAVEHFVMDKYGMSGGLGDNYYNWYMQKYLKAYNHLYGRQLSKPITYQDLIDAGYQSHYKDWLSDSEANMLQDPTRYKKTTDTPFVSQDENTNSGLLVELAPLTGSPLSLFVKRFEQTRLFSQDVLHLKAVLDMWRKAERQREIDPNTMKQRQSDYTVEGSKKAAMRQLNMEFGQQKFGEASDQAPLIRGINKIYNVMQTAPSYHRNFVNSTPGAFEVSYSVRNFINTMKRGSDDFFTNKVGVGVHPKLKGDVFDLKWESSFYNMLYGKSSAKFAQEYRMYRALGQMAGYVASGIIMNYYANQKWKELHPDLPLETVDSWNPFSKKFGLWKVAPDLVTGLNPITRFGRLLRPFQAVLQPSETTEKLRWQAAAQAIGHSIIDSRMQNLGGMIKSGITGTMYDGRPAFEPHPGYIVAGANNLQSPWTPFAHKIFPAQSNWMMGHMNLALTKQYYDTMATLGAVSQAGRFDWQQNGVMGLLALQNVPKVNKAEAWDAIRRTSIPGLFGQTVYFEPELYTRIMHSRVKVGDSQTTFARLVWLMNHNWFDFPGGKEVFDKYGMKGLLQGVPVKSIGAALYDVPTAEILNMSKFNTDNLILPLSGQKQYLYEKSKESPEDIERQKADDKYWDELIDGDKIPDLPVDESNDE